MVMYGGQSSGARRAALEERILASNVIALFDDDGDGLVSAGDLATLESTMADADDIVTGLLLRKGFSLEALEILATDRQVVRAWSGIVAQLGGERRSEWLDEQGRGRYDAFGVKARAELQALARGDIRSVKETEPGVVNTSLSGEVTRGQFIFTDPFDPTGREKGGF